MCFAIYFKRLFQFLYDFDPNDFCGYLNFVRDQIRFPEALFPDLRNRSVRDIIINLTYRRDTTQNISNPNMSKWN